jgi:hypothetical protein
MTATRLILLGVIATAAGCFPDHDYTGDYEMTYAVTMTTPNAIDDVRAGRVDVAIHEGLNDEQFVDLGAQFCRLSATKTDATDANDYPYLVIATQPCWFSPTPAVTYPLILGGSGNVHTQDERLAIVLEGSYRDPKGGGGGVVLQLTEAW